ncbi:MAG: adenylate/guanylate cyclase domain-containing protein [Desulfoprunum sp.]|nr:adenylate/guanylate cyclase domain-containing protein [Desulfoprunum sp.]
MLYRKILIVDTEAITADLCRITLGKLGHQVVCASSGEQAIEIASKTHFDLVLIDGMLPGVDSVDTFEMLRIKDPNIIGILITGHANLKMVVKAMNNGFTGILEKPLDVGRLEKVISTAFSHSEFREENTRLRTLLPLYRLGEKFMEVSSGKEVAEALVAVVSKEIPVLFISVMLFDEQSGLLKIAASRGISDELIPKISLRPGEKIAGWVYENGKPVILNRKTQHTSPFSQLLSRKDIAAAISFPLLGREKVLGVLNISQTKPEIEYSQADLEMLSIICSQAVMALENVSFIREREESARAKALLEQYVSPEVASLLLKNQQNLMNVGAVQELTVLFADIRHFTLLVQHLPPEELRDFLNSFFDFFTREIFACQGTLDKFMGDAALVIFGAPLEIEEPSVAAVTAAAHILRQFEDLRREWAGKSDLFNQIGLGIGLSRGRMFLGNVGSARRLDYTVIGTDVNIAQRLASDTDAGQILMTESVKVDIGDAFAVREEKSRILRGLEKEIRLYSIIPGNPV